MKMCNMWVRRYGDNKIIILKIKKCKVCNIVYSCVRERSVNVSEPESLELTVSNLKPEESYRFRVIAYNDVGPGESSAPLRITTKPDRTTLTCTHTHLNLCSLFWYRVHCFICLNMLFYCETKSGNGNNTLHKSSLLGLTNTINRHDETG